MGEYFLGIDAGTESVRVGVFDANGRQLNFASCEYKTYFPRPGWAEQDPKEWWEALKTASREALKKSGISKEEVKGIGLDATSCTVVLLDKDGNPLRRAILWMDVRAAEEARFIASTHDDALKYNGWGSVSAEWMPCKLLWVKKNEPEIYEKAKTVFEYTDWIVYRLTGRIVGNISSVSIRWYYDNRRGGWPKSFYKKIGLEDAIEKFPREILPLGERVGGLTEEAAEELGLLPGTPVGEGGIDAFVAMIGLNVVKPGRLAFITGSSHLHLGLSEKEFHAPGIFGTYPDSVIPGYHTVEGGQISTGSIVRWFKNNLAGYAEKIAQEKGVSVYDVLNEGAIKIPVGSDGLILIDYFQGNRTPLVDPEVRGMFWGLTLSHTLYHLFRAIMEGVAYGTEHIFRTFQRAGYKPKEVFACGGATKSKLWMQIHSDVSNIPIYLTEEPEAASLGSAILGAVGSGHYKDIQEAAENMVHVKNVIEPNKENNEKYQFYIDKYIRTYQQMKDLMHEMVRHLNEEAKGNGGDK